MMALQRRGRSRSRGRNEFPFADAIFPWLQDRTLHSTRDGKNHRRWLQRAWARLLFGFYMSAVDSGHAVFVSPVTGYRAQVCNVRTRTSTTAQSGIMGFRPNYRQKTVAIFRYRYSSLTPITESSNSTKCGWRVNIEDGHDISVQISSHPVALKPPPTRSAAYTVAKIENIHKV